MIDDPEPGPDPLAGRDPHPREQIDLWPLHDARQELLEEIVSQPGPGESAGRHKILLSVVGIAAALALVAGGAWAVTRDDPDGGKDDDQVVAAQSSDPTATETTTETTETTGSSEPTDESKPPRKRLRPEVRVNGVRIGTVRALRQCSRTQRQDLDEQLERLVRVDRRSEQLKRQRDYVYVVRMDGDRCRVAIRLRAPRH